MLFETKSLDVLMKELNFEINNVKFYDDGDLYNKMKIIEEQISKVHYKYANTLRHAKDKKNNENKIKEIERKIKEKLNVIQHNLNTIDDYSLVFEDDSDGYFLDQIFDEASYVSRKIFEEKLENDYALGLQRIQFLLLEVE